MKKRKVKGVTRRKQHLTSARIGNDRGHSSQAPLTRLRLGLSVVKAAQVLDHRAKVRLMTYFVNCSGRWASLEAFSLASTEMALD